MNARAPADAIGLKRRLADLPGLAKEEVNGALRLTGEDVLAAARTALAAGAHGSSGALADSLSATLDEDAARLTVASSAPYAAFLEYGTRRSGARPFLRPAVAAAHDAALGHVRDALGRLSGRLKDRP